AACKPLANSRAAHPAQSIYGSAGWAVLASDPSLIAQVIQQPEHVGIINFACVWLVTLRYASDLSVPDIWQVSLERCGDVAFHDLGVIEIHLNLQVGRADLLPNRMRLILASQKIAGHVP